jgi:predicted flap endonuclease-1-like 5' DNA nuclease
MTYLLTQMGLYLLCALILGLILGWLIWGRLSAALRKAEADRAELSAQLKARGDGTEERARLDRLSAELDACRKERRVQQEEIDRLNRELDQARSGSGGTAAAAGLGAASLMSAGSADDKIESTAAANGSVAGTKPKTLTAARDGKADDLKLIKGVGQKMENMLNGMGFFHFDQIAAWIGAELAWVDDNLEGFKGRASRDEWVAQAKILASGGTTEFASRNS